MRIRDEEAGEGLPLSAIMDGRNTTSASRRNTPSLTRMPKNSRFNSDYHPSSNPSSEDNPLRDTEEPVRESFATNASNSSAATIIPARNNQRDSCASLYSLDSTLYNVDSRRAIVSPQRAVLRQPTRPFPPTHDSAPSVPENIYDPQNSPFITLDPEPANTAPVEDTIAYYRRRMNESDADRGFIYRVWAKFRDVLGVEKGNRRLIMGVLFLIITIPLLIVVGSVMTRWESVQRLQGVYNEFGD